MNPENSVLSDGISALRQSDRDIDRLLSPREDEIISLLSRYIAEIEFFNSAHSLVGTTDHRELIIRHILDSLSPLGILHRLLPENRVTPAGTPRIADAGSGAGLPGIPLAIARPEINFTLIERMKGRAEFLRNTAAKLGLFNVRVEEAQVEELARRPTETGCYALVTFRAFRPLEPKLLKRLLKFPAEGGVLAAYKGRREKIEAETAILEQSGCQWEIIPCPVPGLDEERHILVICRAHSDFLKIKNN